MIIEECDRNKLLEKEQFYIDKINPWFNVCPIAGNTINRPCPQSTKEKLRIFNTGKKQSQETIDKRVAKTKGQKRVFTEEHIRHIKESRKRGKEHPYFGKSSPAKGYHSKYRGIPLKEGHKAKLRQKRSEKTKECIRQSWVKRKEEGEIGKRDGFGRFKKN
jgi:hypothetical protein